MLYIAFYRTLFLTMALQNEFTETTSCTLCGHGPVTPYRIESYPVRDGHVELGLNQCPKCGMRFTSPRLNDRGLNYLYNEGYQGQTVSGAYNTEDEVSAAEYEAFHRYVHECLPSGGRVLDVGCGVGLLLERFKGEAEMQIEGIEYSEYAAVKARARGFEVALGTLENAGFPDGYFDAITILYVLEHVPNPREVLTAIHQILKPGGYLCLSVPNYRYLRLRGDNRVIRALNPKASIHPEEHLQNFTPVTMERMVTESGFSIHRREMAKPLRIGSPVVRSVKSCAHLAFSALAACGYQMGGIHLIARKPAD